MGKFGFGKKNADGEDDPNRSSLFGSRSSKTAAGAPASTNPYAQPQIAADPYTQDTKNHADMGREPVNRGVSGPGAPPPYPGNGDRYGANRGPSGPSPYGGDRSGGIGGGDVGDRYGQGSQYGGGGYGGLGRTRSNEMNTADDNRNALFGDAQNRYQQRSHIPPMNGQPGAGAGAAGGYGDPSGAYGAGNESGYGAYGEDRKLTAEEEEEEDVQAAKQQIRLTKQQDVSSTRNALRIAAQAEETGRGTLERLAAQGERIHTTEKNLDLATNHNRIAEERAKQLKTLNKSMFAVHVSNPFTKTSRLQARDDDIIEKNRAEREQRDATRAAAFASKARADGAFRDLRPGEPGYDAEKQKSRLAERAKYQFEADSEDDEMEGEIDRNLDSLGQAAGRLNAVARATGREVDEQNRQIDKIIKKVLFPLPLPFYSSLCLFAPSTLFFFQTPYGSGFADRGLS